MEQLFLISMAFFLGIRHGFDLDHLATIDSIARMTSTKPIFAKLSGFLFSLGHGLIVIFISLIIGTGFKPAHIPSWLDGLGNTISITFLLMFGILNLWNVLVQPSQIYFPIGLKSYLSRKLINPHCNPFVIILIGALFALSFDTVSQVVLFSLSASALSGCLFSGLLGIVFMLGMTLSDGLNGLFVSTLIQRANTLSVLFSRFISLTISLFSLIIGINNLLKIYN